MAQTKKIDLNTAGVDELANISGVGRQRAQHIIEYREQFGNFENWNDIDNIPGISGGMAEALKQGGATIGDKSISKI